jgi:hypothetical protein
MAASYRPPLTPLPPSLEERGVSFDETLQFIAAGHSHG